MNDKTKDLEGIVDGFLRALGEDPGREGLLKTPERVAKAFQYLTGGYDDDPRAVLNGAVFSERYDQLVLCKDIQFYSLCEHHLLPFFGHAHIAYLPGEGGKIIGLSKMPRLVQVFSRRLQVQERLTLQIADTIEELIAPRGVAVMVEALHLCVAMRGVEDAQAQMVTRSWKGAFDGSLELQNEFLRLVSMPPKSPRF